MATATRHGFADLLSAIPQILEEGNPALQWLALHRRGKTPGEILEQATRECEEYDLAGCRELEEKALEEAPASPR